MSDRPRPERGVRIRKVGCEGGKRAYCESQPGAGREQEAGRARRCGGQRFTRTHSRPRPQLSLSSLAPATACCLSITAYGPRSHRDEGAWSHRTRTPAPTAHRSTRRPLTLRRERQGPGRACPRPLPAGRGRPSYSGPQYRRRPTRLPASARVAEGLRAGARVEGSGRQQGVFADTSRRENVHGRNSMPWITKTRASPSPAIFGAAAERQKQYVEKSA